MSAIPAVHGSKSHRQQVALQMINRNIQIGHNIPATYCNILTILQFGHNPQHAITYCNKTYADCMYVKEIYDDICIYQYPKKLMYV